MPPNAKSRPPRVLLLRLRGAMRTGALEYAHKAGWVPIICTALPGPESPEALIENWDIEAVLCDYVPLGEDPRQWQRTTLPTVALYSFNAVQARVPVVEVDHAGVGAAAARHFLQRGFQHLAYCMMSPEGDSAVQRDAFRDAAERAGRKFHCLDWVQRGQGRYRYPGEFRLWLAEELSALPTPLGLLVDNPWAAVETLEACNACGRLVPEQVAVIAVDEDPVLCENAPLPISTIDSNHHAQGYQAAALLDRLMHARGHWRRAVPRKKIHIVPGRLIVRQSSDILAVPHVEVAKAVRFIWENYANARLGVDDVVSTTTLSRPGLYLAFRRHLGHSVVEELRRVRLNRARELLATTNRTVQDVAAACGYRDAEHLRATVHRASGMSPRAWRKQQRARD